MSSIKTKRVKATFAIIVGSILFVFLSFFFSEHGEWASNNLIGWGANMLIFIIILSQISKGLGLPWYGFLIDKTRKRFSLSRLQLVIWTVMILSAYMSINFTAFWGYFFDICCGDIPRPQNIDSSVLMLMGISTGSALAAPVVNQVKSSLSNSSDNKNKEAKGSDSSSTFENILYNAHYPKQRASNIGNLYINGDIKKTSILDIFRGEEVKDYDLIDMSKVQNFIFTLVAVVFYGFELAVTLSGDNPTLPVVNANLINIILISHSYYIVSKAVPQSVPAKKLPMTESSDFVDGTLEPEEVK